MSTNTLLGLSPWHCVFLTETVEVDVAHHYNLAPDHGKRVLKSATNTQNRTIQELPCASLNCSESAKDEVSEIHIYTPSGALGNWLLQGRWQVSGTWTSGA